MTREEQLQFCRVCKNKSSNPHKGIICSLTNERGDFDGVCPNYDENIQEAEKARLLQAEKERQTKENLTISGWLALFLWLGIGGGSIGTIIFTLASFSGLSITPLLGIILFIYLLCYVVCAVLTIKAFYKRENNAVSLARTYIAMVFIDIILSLVIIFITDDFSYLPMTVRSFVWGIIWFSYLSFSERVKEIIPPITRTWEKTEKIILIIFTVISLAFCFGTCYSVKNPMSSVLFSKTQIIDSWIEEMNKSLPDNSNPEISVIRAEREKDKIVLVSQFKSSFQDVNKPDIDLISLRGRQELLHGIANGTLAELHDIMTIIFGEGDKLCYRYLDNNSMFLYDIAITGYDYFNALEAGANFKCEDSAYKNILDYFNNYCPTEYIGGTTLINIKHTDNVLSFEMKLPEEVDMMVVDGEYMRKYLKEYWADIHGIMHDLAFLGKETIEYRIYTAAGKVHSVATFTYEEYSRLIK
jgi:hypothetical protein